MKAIPATRLAALLIVLTAATPTVAQDAYRYGRGPYGYGVGVYAYGPAPVLPYGPGVYGYAAAYGYNPGYYAYRSDYPSLGQDPDLFPTGSEPWWQAMDASGRGGHRD